MTDDKLLKYLFICLISLIILGTLVVALRSIQGFEMTPQLKIETAQLEMCIMYNISSKSCDAIYGGIPK